MKKIFLTFCVLFVNMHAMEKRETITAGIEKQEVADDECVICFEKLYNGSKNVLILKCDKKHVYHAACVNDYLYKKGECPTCRKPNFIDPVVVSGQPDERILEWHKKRSFRKGLCIGAFCVPFTWFVAPLLWLSQSSNPEQDRMHALVLGDPYYESVNEVYDE